MIAKEKPTAHMVHVRYAEAREPQNGRARDPATNSTGPAWDAVGGGHRGQRKGSSRALSASYRNHPSKMRTPLCIESSVGETVKRRHGFQCVEEAKKVVGVH